MVDFLKFLLLTTVTILLLGLNAFAQKGNDSENPDKGRSQQEEQTASDAGPKHIKLMRDVSHGAQRPGFAPTAGGTGAASPILYHGGPVMSQPKIYIIFYGNWNQTNGSDTLAGQQIVVDWANSIGSSAHYALNSTYGVAGFPTNGTASFGGATTLTGQYNNRLSDSQILSTVVNTINSGVFGAFNPNGVYFLVTSSDVTAKSGFCTRYCGWHSHSVQSFGGLKYSFVGNAKRCLNGCAAQSISPNNNPGIDGAISVLTHELEEAHSDPDLNAWYDGAGAENADKCAWTFGHFQYQVSNGSFANMRLGTRDYLIQRNLWHTIGGDFCMVDSTHN